MPRIKPLLPAALLLGLGLAGCEATQDLQDKFTGALHDFNPMGTAKRPLPGNRKALFP
ncbi:MAG: hypothetical protein IT538_14795, partial [Variibacter sp.]|nr:hypothetical protein [Variibacter sp.]